MKFNFSDYKGKYVMHCKTRNEAEEFCRLMYENRKTWSNGIDYIDKTNFESYAEDTCYNFNEGCFTYIDFYKNSGYKILEWSDFMEGEKAMTKSDLKTGHLVKTRNGEWWFVCRDMINESEKDLIVRTAQDEQGLNITEFMRLDSYAENLNCTDGIGANEYDIVAIANVSFAFEFFEYERFCQAETMTGFEIIWGEVEKSEEQKEIEDIQGMIDNLQKRFNALKSK